MISQTLAGSPQPGPHGIQGIGAGFIPETLDLKMVDAWKRSTDEESSRWLAGWLRKKACLGGISCGAASWPRFACEGTAMEGKTIVVILPDSGERYLSTTLFDAYYGLGISS